MAVDPVKAKKITEDYLKKVDALTLKYKKDMATLMQKITNRKIEAVRKQLQ
jgi:hypothetical protein